MDRVSVAERVGRNHEAEYRDYLAFMSGANAELQAIRGYGMLPSEREDFTRSFYADSYREEVRKLV